MSLQKTRQEPALARPAYSHPRSGRLADRMLQVERSYNDMLGSQNARQAFKGFLPKARGAAFVVLTRIRRTTQKAEGSKDPQMLTVQNFPVHQADRRTVDVIGITGPLKARKGRAAEGSSFPPDALTANEPEPGFLGACEWRWCWRLLFQSGNVPSSAHVAPSSSGRL